LPNAGVIGHALKTYREDVLSVEAVLFAITQLTLLGYAVKCWVGKFFPESNSFLISQKKCSNPDFRVSRCVLPEYPMCASGSFNRKSVGKRCSFGRFGSLPSHHQEFHNHHLDQKNPLDLKLFLHGKIVCNGGGEIVRACQRSL